MTSHKEAARMADWVLASDRLTFPPWWRGRDLAPYAGHLEWLQEALGRAAVVVVDNVAEYFYAGTDKEEWDGEKDFPCLAPPFPVLWMEYRAPRKVVSSVYGTTYPEGEAEGAPSYYGFLIAAAEPRAADFAVTGPAAEALAVTAAAAWGRYGAAVTAKVAGRHAELWRCKSHAEIAAAFGLSSGELHALLAAMALGGVRALGLEGFNARMAALKAARPEVVPRWVLNASCYFYYRTRGGPHGGLAGPMAAWTYPLDDGGAPVPRATTFGLPAPPGATPDFDFDNLNTLAFPCFMAMTFMNCKNVTAQEEAPPADADRAFAARHGRPLVTFRTLRIEPMTAAARAAGQAPGAPRGLNPLHVCRGHFKDYRERGLFGQHRGIYWWDNYVRGAIERGVVFKDYSVDGP
jgi:hypothetical protein